MAIQMRNIIRISKNLLFLIICIFITSWVLGHTEDPGHEEYSLGNLQTDNPKYENDTKEEYKAEPGKYKLEAGEYVADEDESKAEVAEVKVIADELKADNVDNEVPVKKLPGVAILGVKKCGTIALSTILKMHPKIEKPKKTEIWFWTLWTQFRKGLDHYKNQMPFVRSDQTVVVATPGILDKPEDTTFLKRLHDAIPEVKVLLIVKNPIDRLVSDILHEYSAAQHKDETMPEVDDIIMGRTGQIQQKGLSELSLNEMIFYLSNYTLIYEMVSQVFPRGNILVVNGDKIVTEPLQEIRRVETFLGLPPFFQESHFVYPEDGRFPCFKFGEYDLCMDPKHKGREHPPLKSETLDYLQQYFQPMVDMFFQQTGISLHNFMNKFEN